MLLKLDPKLPKDYFGIIFSLSFSTVFMFLRAEVKGSRNAPDEVSVGALALEIKTKALLQSDRNRNACSGHLSKEDASPPPKKDYNFLATIHAYNLNIFENPDLKIAQR